MRDIAKAIAMCGLLAFAAWSMLHGFQKCAGVALAGAVFLFLDLI